MILALKLFKLLSFSTLKLQHVMISAEKLAATQTSYSVLYLAHALSIPAHTAVTYIS